MGGLMTTSGGKALPVHLKDPVPASEGPRAIQFSFDFSGGTTEIPVSLNAADYGLSIVQTAFIDNSNNGSAITLAVNGSNQKLTCPPYSQGYFPIMLIGPTLSLIAKSAGGVAVAISFLNVYAELSIWNVTAPGSVTGAVTVNGTVTLQPQGAVFTNRSGAIGTGGTSQQLAAANGARKRIIVQNPSTEIESLFIRFGAAAGVNDGVAFEILPGGAFDSGAAPVSTEQIQVVATTAGHKFIAQEM